MDRGGRFGGMGLLRFNGHFFRDADALPLTANEIALLGDAAQRDWSDVEPTIFGTLLTRALDPVERHRLGAEYTPRAYVERVVRQAVEVPVRERWSPVLAEVLQLRESGRRKDRAAAIQRLRDFHAWLCGLRFLDPACGSGNFLYVTLHSVKRIELEVLRELADLTGNPELGLEEVRPRQFHGIEVKPWAREIAELTLWIGFHQFWKEHHKGVNPPEPVLEDTGTLEQRDAVLAWDEVREVPEKSRPDPTPRIVHPVTGKMVPDPGARLTYFKYVGARQAEWPRADFIVGNPPYMGKSLLRTSLGDGYVDAIRAAYPDVSDGVDFVMLWWHRAAREVAAGHTTRAGLITTSSIRQPINRTVIEAATAEGACIVWAVPEHPWVDLDVGADVTVAFTVLSREAGTAVRVEVDKGARVVREIIVPSLNADLSAHADVGSAAKAALRANVGLAANGFLVYGRGFILPRKEAEQLISRDPRHRKLIAEVRNGRDLAARPRNHYVIDTGLRTEGELKQTPVIYDLLRNRVKPYRDTVKDTSRRAYWWRFGRTNENLRAALHSLPRYVGTPYVGRHRYFVFLPREVLSEDSVVCIATASAFHLGLLSSTLHVAWALAAGGRLGVGNDPRYNKTLCFDPFPFPDAPKHLRDPIALLAETLDQHRKDALARDERVTMTGMYNVVEKLRADTPLTPKERAVHEIAACGVLRDLHDTLDALVAEAYGWPWPMEREEILERLVALHDERVEEEKRGLVRWLRPEYQVPRYGSGIAEPEPAELDLADAEDGTAPPEPANAWPSSAVDQLAALQAYVAARPATPAEAAAAFPGAREDLVRRHLETLALVGEVRVRDDDRFEAVTEPV